MLIEMPTCDYIPTMCASLDDYMCIHDYMCIMYMCIILIYISIVYCINSYIIIDVLYVPLNVINYLGFAAYVTRK